MESQYADQHHRHSIDHAEFQKHHSSSGSGGSTSHADGNRYVLILSGNTEETPAEYSFFQRISFHRYFHTLLDQVRVSIRLCLRLIIYHSFLQRSSFRNVLCFLPFGQSVHIFVQRSEEVESQ